MGKVTLRETQYLNFGKCVELSNGTVRLLVTVDVGPRIINFSYIDGENIMLEDVERKVCESGPTFEKFGGGSWYIYGGHRLWVSPEGMPKSYYPDNEPVAYEAVENGAVFTQNVQKWNQYQFQIEVTMEPDSNRVKLVHRVTNHAAWPVELAPWALTVLTPGGMEVVPQPTKDTGLLGNRLLALWPYTRMNDERVCWGDKYTTLRQDPAAQEKFKFGINSEHGYAMYFVHGDLFIKRFNPIPDGNYPDGGMNFETFTNQHFIEMETLGETCSLQPGATVEHSESWELAKEACPGNDEQKIAALVSKYIG